MAWKIRDLKSGRIASEEHLDGFPEAIAGLLAAFDIGSELIFGGESDVRRFLDGSMTEVDKPTLLLSLFNGGGCEVELELYWD